MPRRTPSKVRAPFVVTAAVAALAGCGARIDEPSATKDGGVETSTDDGVDPGCPSVTPRHGDVCSGDMSCEYGARCYDTPTTTARCTEGKWSVSHMSCNPPPPPRCPTSEPSAGAACGVDTGMRCTYPDPCGPKGVTIDWFCKDGRWTEGPVLAALLCPATAPRHNDSCRRCAARIPTICNYDPCGSSYSTEARCDATTGLWSVSTRSCNPPPPDAG